MKYWLISCVPVIVCSPRKIYGHNQLCFSPCRLLISFSRCFLSSFIRSTYLASTPVPGMLHESLPPILTSVLLSGSSRSRCWTLIETEFCPPNPKSSCFQSPLANGTLLPKLFPNSSRRHDSLLCCLPKLVAHGSSYFKKILNRIHLCVK